MPKFRVTEVTDVEADTLEDAIAKVAASLDGEVISQDAEVLGRPKGEPGCPECGGTFIEVTVSAIALVTLGGIEHGHVDEIVWEEARDVDLTEATSFNCRNCDYRQDVEGDSELFEALALKWH